VPYYERSRIYYRTFIIKSNPPAAPIIAGIDEAGRGPLAGPVVAAACILPCPVTPIGEGRWQLKAERGAGCIVGDSKQLSARQREAAFSVLDAVCVHGIGIVDAPIIDRVGILEATQLAMQQAVARLAKRCKPTYLLVDGRDRFWFDVPHSSVIRGDSLEPAIAAASILAKVTRDRLMIEADAVFPHYGFARHKGYGTPEHREAMERHGLCVLHRKTFC